MSWTGFMYGDALAKLREVIGDSQQRFVVAFCLFLPAGFFLPTPVWALTFYLLVLPSLIWVLWLGIPGALSSRSAILAIGLCAYFLVSVAWSTTESHFLLFKWSSRAVFTSCFIAAAVIFFSRPARTIDFFFDVLILAATANAVLSVVLHLLVAPSLRLHGLAETRHPILGASIIGLCAVIALHRLLADPDRSRRILRSVSLVFLVAFVLLTGSRGPLISLLLGAGVLLFFRGPRVALCACAALAMIVGVMLTIGPFADIAKAMFLRDPKRLQLWLQAWEAVSLHPFVGYGVATRFSTEPGLTFPHGLFISALYYGGIVGLGLLLGLFTSVLADIRRTWSISAGPFLLALLVHAGASAVTDLGQPIKGPSELWIILWFPLAAIIGIVWRLRQISTTSD